MSSTFVVRFSPATSDLNDSTFINSPRTRNVAALVSVFFVLLMTTFAAKAQNVAATLSVGSQPKAIAVNPVTNKIYVANYASGTVSVIDGATNTVATIAVGAQPIAIAVNAKTNKIYIANAASNSVTTIDGATSATTTLPTVSQPLALAVDSVLNRIYVACEVGVVMAIDGATNTQAGMMGGGAGPAVALAVNPRVHWLYVANRDSNGVTIFDGLTNAQISMVPTAPGPEAVGIDPATNRIYVASAGSATTTVLNGLQFYASVPSGNASTAVAVNPVTNKIYVANNGNNSVTVIDGTNNASTIVGTGAFPIAVAVDVFSNRIYVAQQGGGVAVIDGATNVVTTTLAAGAYPSAVAVNPLTGKAYVTNRDSNSVTVIDGASLTSTGVPVGPNPQAVAINPVTNKVYVPSVSGVTTVIDGATNGTTAFNSSAGSVAAAVNPATNKIYLVNKTNNSVMAVDGATNAVTLINVGSQPTAVAVNPVSNKIYVANYQSSSVTVIDGATNSTRIVGVPGMPQAVAVNTATNRVYVASAGSNTVTVLNGVNDSVIVTVPMGGSDPRAIAVNPVTNRIYAVGYISGSVTMIDGNTNAPFTFGSNGSAPIAVAVNPETNRIYVVNSGTNNVAVFDGATNAFRGAVGTGLSPQAIAIDSARNRIYVTNCAAGSVTMIDGVTYAIQTLGANTNPVAIAVNPLTGKVYVAGSASSDVVIFTPRPTQNVLLSNVVQGVDDGNLVSGLDLFATRNPSPSFTARATSSFAPFPLAPSALFYKLGSVQGNWTRATQMSGSGANPADFEFTFADLAPGIYTAYAYGVYGDEGTPATSYEGSGNSPIVGNVSAYTFEVLPIVTTTTVTSDVNPQIQGSSVTFTATVAPQLAGTNLPTGPVTFYDGATVLATVALDGNLQALYATSALSAGAHTITAAYLGDARYLESSSTVDQQIGMQQTITFGPIPDQTYGVAPITLTATASSELAVQYEITSGPAAVSGDVITITGAGQVTVKASQPGDATYAPATPVSVMFNVLTKPATVTPTAASKTYGSTDPSLAGTLSGFVAADNVTATYSRGAGETVAGGPYTISATLAPAGVLANYSITYDTAQFTINPAMATVTPLAASKIYGSSDPDFSGTLTGFQAADNVTATYTRAAGDTVAGGPYTITATLSPTSILSNYDITYETAAFTVTPAAASVTPEGSTKVYGGSDPAFTGTLSGFVAADSVTATYSRAAGETVSGGPYAISATLTPPEVLTNYTVAYNTANFTITPAAATVRPNAATKTYGFADPTFTGIMSGFLAADNITATYSRTAGETVASGPYTISATLSPASMLSNYDVSYETAQFSITPAAATVTPNAANKAYGSSDPVLTGTLAGFVAADNIVATYSRAAGESVAGGPYTISATLSPAVTLGNYNITYNSAAFTITPAAASVQPSPATKTYGSSDPVLTGVLTGFAAADDITATYTRAAGETVAGGPYTISATLAPVAALNNYTVTSGTALLTITPATLNVVVNNKSRAYGADNPSLDGTITGLAVGDVITASYSTTATSTSDPGAYSITATLADPDSRLPNYTVTNNPGTLTVTKAPSSVAIVPDPASVLFGSSVTLTATVGVNATATPTGTVTFKDGQTTLASVALDGTGKAAYSTTAFTAGAHSITAEYGGDTRYGSSASAIGSVTVQDFTLPTNPPALSVTAGQTQTANVAVTPQYGFSGTVSFTCSVPASMTQSSCSASSVQVTGTAAVNSTLTITTAGPHRIAANRNGGPWYAATFGSVFAGFFFLGVPISKRRRNLIVACLVMLVLLGALAGCGGSSNDSTHTDPGTPAGTYLLSITASSGTAAHTMTVSVTVQ